MDASASQTPQRTTWEQGSRYGFNLVKKKKVHDGNNVTFNPLNKKCQEFKVSCRGNFLKNTPMPSSLQSQAASKAFL